MNTQWHGPLTTFKVRLAPTPISCYNLIDSDDWEVMPFGVLIFCRKGKVVKVYKEWVSFGLEGEP